MPVSWRSRSFSLLAFGSTILSCRAFLVNTQRRTVPRKRVSNLYGSMIPEKNPYADTSKASLSGVRYSAVLSGLNKLFPPEGLDRRNALSRTDGYWPYIQKGEDPPQELTYGEFDLYFFAEILDLAHSYYFEGSDDSLQSDWSDKVFVDIGSGTGRLVFAASALHPNLRKCRGVELLPSIHSCADENLQKCRIQDGSYALVGEESLSMAPVELICGSFKDPYVYLGDANIIFVFSSCMGPDLLTDLAKSIGRQCKPGTIVITTDYMLPLEGEIERVEDDDRIPWGPYKLDMVHKADGWCWLTGGASTAFIHRVTKSLWKEGQGPIEPPQRTVEDVAFDVAMALESGKLTDTESFLRGVSNNIIFHGLPESFLPKKDTDE